MRSCHHGSSSLAMMATNEYIYVALLKEDENIYCLGFFDSYEDALYERPEIPVSLRSSMGSEEWVLDPKGVPHVWRTVYVDCMGRETSVFQSKEFQILVLKLDNRKRVD